VPETWFFRDREPFAALSRFAVTEWLTANPARPLRLLSAPCATGEEPYSMAMALLDAGLQPNRFHIDAVDISAEALAQARAGIYGRNSFRGKGLEFRERHFAPVPDGHAPHDAVRQSVHFQRANLVAPNFLAGRDRYDVIFCRNVLIYFDRPPQRRVIQTLDRLLTPAGILFVGHAETGLFVDSDFVSAKLPMAFAYRKTSHVLPGELKKPSAQKIARIQSSKLAGVSSPQKAAPVSTRPAPRAWPATPGPNSPVPNRSSSLDTPAEIHPIVEEAALEQSVILEKATRLADAGDLDEAANLCESHLRCHGASAPAYYLLGLVQDARGNPQLARESYRKVIYLEPNHYEALLHLALLSEQSGEQRDARQWRHRAHRVKARSKS